jgi:MFS family permease
MSVVTFSSIAGRLLFGWLSDIIPPRYVFALSFAVMLLACLAFTFTGSSLGVFLALALFGPGMGGHFTERMIIQRSYFGRKNFGLTHGIIQMLGAVPAFGGPIFAGWMFDIYGSYLPAYSMLTFLWLIAILIILMAKPPKRN